MCTAAHPDPYDLGVQVGRGIGKAVDDAPNPASAVPQARALAEHLAATADEPARWAALIAFRDGFSEGYIADPAVRLHAEFAFLGRVVMELADLASPD